MNKVVINECFGGFSISTAAAEWMAERGHKDAAKGLEMSKNSVFNSTSLSRVGHVCLWHTPRHDPLLVKCVETLGKKASGNCADLKVKQISSNRYYIENYDGMETLHTEDNIDWTVIK